MSFFCLSKIVGVVFGLAIGFNMGFSSEEITKNIPHEGHSVRWFNHFLSTSKQDKQWGQTVCIVASGAVFVAWG